MSLSVGSLFSGVGGIDLGLERAGMQVRWQVEIDDHASKVLAKHWPDVARFRDVRDCGAHNLEPVDLICGGFPCQDVSLAGKRAGLSGQRTTLWGEFARIVRQLRPRWVLAENVPGLLSSDSGRFFGTVLRDLAQSGFDAEWDVLSAAQFGALHLRKRVFLVAYPNGCQQGRGIFTKWQQTERDTYLAGDGAQGDMAHSSECRQLGANHHNGKHTEEGRSEGKSPEDVGQSGKTGSKPPILADAHWKGLAERQGQSGNDGAECTSTFRASWWATEPNVGRVANGIPKRVDRLRCLGNAVVPQVAEYVGGCIMAAERSAE